MKKIISLVLCCLLLTGCAFQPTGTTAPAESTTPMESTHAPEITDPTTHPTEAGIPLKIFVADENAESFITISTVIDALDGALILEMLIEHNVLNEDIVLNSAELVDSQLNLDFNQAFLDQLLTYGTVGERMMIYSVVNTYLNAYGAETVYITVSGEIMESGHVVYNFPIKFFE